MTIHRNPLSGAEWRLTGEFDSYRSLLALLDQELQSKLRERREVLEEAIDSTQDEEIQIELDLIISDEGVEGEKFKSILFNSFFVASFALFEHKLSTICQEAQRTSGAPFEEKRRSSTMARAKTYLKKLGVEFPVQQDSCWEEITKYQQLRNKIMHEGAVLSDKKELLKYAEMRYIASSWGGRVMVEMTRPFCEKAIDNLTQFLLKLYRAYDNWSQKNDEVQSEEGRASSGIATAV